MLPESFTIGTMLKDKPEFVNNLRQSSPVQSALTTNQRSGDIAEIDNFYA
jgi:hypothetical protein